MQSVQNQSRRGGAGSNGGASGGGGAGTASVRAPAVLGRATPRLPADLQAWQPTSDAPFNSVRAGHLMNRAGFGGTPEELAALVEMGLERSVDALLDFPDAPATELSPTDVPDESPLAEVPRNARDRRLALLELRNRYPDEDQQRTQRQLLSQAWRRGSIQHMAECTRWWVRRMAFGPYPLQERLVLFWHGHFTSSFRDDQVGSWRLWGQNELLRRFAAGNFHALVRHISRDPAMLRYLNNDRNVARSPNENYARELMELFTLGEGNYTEQDIREVARAFTGWSHDGEVFEFRQRQHDGGEKTIFGRRGNFGGDDVAEMLMQHPACGPYIAGRVFHYFVGTPATRQQAEALGGVLRGSNYELRPLLRVVLRSRAFWEDARIGGRIKSPLHLVAGTCKLLGVDVPATRVVNRELDKMGQIPFQPPNVEGWPGQYDSRRWINTATLLARYNFAVAMAGGIRRVGPSDKPPGELVSEWVERLITRPINPGKQRRLVANLGTRPGRTDVAGLVRLIVSMPEYQLS